MIACKQKPRRLFSALCYWIVPIFVFLAGPVQAELAITVTAENQVMVAGECGTSVVFGSDEASGGVIIVPLSSWGAGDSTNDMGNGTGGDSSGDNGTDDMGNGTGTRDMGNGTGSSIVTTNWGEAAVSLRCNEADVIVYRYDSSGNLIEEEATVIATNYCP